MYIVVIFSGVPFNEGYLSVTSTVVNIGVAT